VWLTSAHSTLFLLGFQQDSLVLYLLM